MQTRSIQTVTTQHVEHVGCRNVVCFVDNHPAFATAIAPIIGLLGVVITVLVTSILSRNSLLASIEKESRDRAAEQEKQAEERSARLREIADEKESKRASVSVVLRQAAARCVRLSRMADKKIPAMWKRDGVVGSFALSQRLLERGERELSLDQPATIFALDHGTVQIAAIQDALKVLNNSMSNLDENEKLLRLAEISSFMKSADGILRALADVNDGAPADAVETVTMVYHWGGKS